MSPPTVAAEICVQKTRSRNMLTWVLGSNTYLIQDFRQNATKYALKTSSGPLAGARSLVFRLVDCVADGDAVGLN